MDSAQRLYKPPANEDAITEAVRQGHEEVQLFLHKKWVYMKCMKYHFPQLPSCFDIVLHAYCNDKAPTI